MNAGQMWYCFHIYSAKIFYMNTFLWYATVCKNHSAKNWWFKLNAEVLAKSTAGEEIAGNNWSCKKWMKTSIWFFFFKVSYLGFNEMCVMGWFQYNSVFLRLRILMYEDNVTHSESRVCSQLQEAFDSWQTQVGCSDVQRCSEIKVTASGIYLCKGRLSISVICSRPFSKIYLKKRK